MKKNAVIKGSFTIEAVFIMPIILIGVYFLIYLAMYLHDLGYSQSVLDIATQYEALYMRQPSEFDSSEIKYESIIAKSSFGEDFDDKEKRCIECKDYIKNQLSKKMMISELDYIRTDLNSGRISAEVSLHMNLTISCIQRLFTNLSSYRVVSNTNIHNPTSFCRKVDEVYDTVSEIKGVEKLEDLIQSKKK